MSGRATVVARERTPRLGAAAVEMLESLYQHRLLSTGQVHALHTPTASVRFTQQQLARLQNAGLAASVHAVGALKLWFLSERGADAAETIGSRAETRRKVIAPEQAAGPLQQHTLAVNDVGVAFVEAARDRGDECGPFAWRHEIAHALPPAPGRHTPEQLIADAILAYQLGEPDGGTSFYYRFIELDRATMPTDELAAKLARIPGGLDAALFPFRFDRLRRLPMTYGPLSKRPVPREVMDRWFGPIREQREIRRDLRKYVRSAAQGRRDLLAAMDKLAAFDRPALIAWASEDRLMPPEHGRRLAELLPHGRLVEITDSYTLISEDQPATLIAHMRELLAQTQPVS